jgi:hypothetical protein
MRTTIQSVDLKNGSTVDFEWKDFHIDGTVKVTVDGCWYREDDMCQLIKALKRVRREMRSRECNLTRRVTFNYQ